MSFRSYTFTNGEVDLPTTQESSEALEFIGFNTPTANHIFSRWLARGDGNPDGLIDYVLAHVRGRNQNGETRTNPRAAMNAMGLLQEFSEVHLDPGNAEVRDTETMIFWIQDTLTMRYKTIDLCNRRLKRAAARGKRSKKVKRESITSYVWTSEPSVPEVSATIDGPEEAVNAILPRLPASHIAVGSAGPVLPYHIVLYKGKSAAEVGEDFIMPGGSVNMAAIATAPGGDFNCDRRAWYWTEEEAVAEKYRGWAAERNGLAESWIIRVQIPTSFMSRLRREELNYSTDWKEYIWLCRKQLMLPSKFNKFAEEADVMCGHICSRDNGRVTSLKKEEVHSQITERWVMRLNNNRNTRIVFMKANVANEVASHVCGNMHITVIAALERQTSQH